MSYSLGVSGAAAQQQSNIASWAAASGSETTPFGYLKDVLERLPTHPRDRLAELMPACGSRTIRTRDARSVPDGPIHVGRPELDPRLAITCNVFGCPPLSPGAIGVRKTVTTG